MRKICCIFLIFGCVQLAWTVSPKIAQPLEQAIIKKDKLLIFVEPTPQDIEEKRYLFIEIYNRTTGKSVAQKKLSPLKNYQTLFNIKSWETGKYFLKAVYVNKKGKHLTKSSWRNFSIQHQSD